MASDIWLRTIPIARKETRCRHIGYSFWLPARVLLYAPTHRQDSRYHGLCYTSRGALAGTRNSSMGPSHEGSIRRPITPWANTLTTELHLTPTTLLMSDRNVLNLTSPPCNVRYNVLRQVEIKWTFTGVCRQELSLDAPSRLVQAPVWGSVKNSHIIYC